MIRRCSNHDVCDAFGTRIVSLASDPIRLSSASSVTLWRESSACTAAQKNMLRRMWVGTSRLIRPQGSPGPRPVLRRYSHLPGTGAPPGQLPELWQSETGEAGLAGQLPLLHEAVRLPRGAALPGREHPGGRPGIALGLEDSQDAGDAVHGGTAAAARDAGAESHRHRRTLDPQGAHLSHRCKRSAAEAADLV